MEYQYSVVYHYNSSLMILNEQLALPVHCNCNEISVH